MYSIEMEALKGTPCACGELSFERVVIEREGREPYRTDFIACVFCQAVFLAPMLDAAAQADAKLNVACQEQRLFTKSGKRRKM